ncbi:serine hydrolase [Sphingobacterium corticis]|uniref:Serine hydrolase n=1 Tax=Sphingobacterium corticis TaxID=1812823 RepID=A0ABW5NR07_9SPHI
MASKIRCFALKLFFLTIVMLSASPVNAQEKKAVDWHLVDSLLEKVRNDYHVGGFSVAVVHKDSVIYSKGFGYRNIEQKSPATSETLYAIGSSTKAFTAGLLGKLFSDSLSLDDRLIKHLPALEFQDHRESQLTVRDLMSHRTGLSRYDFSWYLFNTSSRDSLLMRVKHMKPTADIRTTWLYNNFMYLAQGMIAERMTGKTWEDNIQSSFFKPLNMSSSNLSIASLKESKAASLGYTTDKDGNNILLPYYNINGMGPAGSINSSAKEMANWLKIWLNNGKYNNQQILPAKYVLDAISAQMIMNSRPPQEGQPNGHISNYGLGWMMGTYRNHFHVEHGGNIDGFSSSVGFFPKDSIGIVVLTNQNASEAPNIVRNLIADQVLELPFYNWNTRGTKKEKKSDDEFPSEDFVRVKNTKPSHVLSDYTGQYSHPAYSHFEISLKNDSLQLQMGEKHFYLTHYHYDTFNIYEKNNDIAKDDDDEKQQITFHTGFDSEIKSAEMLLPEPVEFSRQAKAKEIDPKEFDSYVGKYTIGNMTITITVKDNTVFMDVPGQKNYETIAQGNHAFKIKDLSGFSVRFEVDENTKKATKIYLIQPNGTFSAKRVDD